MCDLAWGAPWLIPVSPGWTVSCGYATCPRLTICKWTSLGCLQVRRCHPARTSAVAAQLARSRRDLAFIRGPDGCELRVRQLMPEPRDSSFTVKPDIHGRTTRLPRVPEELRVVALALCEPLLQGSQLPASYAQIGARAGLASRKAVRNQVERLTDLYLEEIPAVRELVLARLDREARQLGLASVPYVRGGVVRFETADLVDAAEQERRSALALPTYYEVAHLLLRRRMITESDLAALTTSASRDQEVRSHAPSTHANHG